MSKKVWTYQSELYFRNRLEDYGKISTFELCEYEKVPETFLREMRDEIDWEIISLRMWFLNSDFKKEFETELKEEFVSSGNERMDLIRIELKVQLATLLNI